MLREHLEPDIEVARLPTSPDKLPKQTAMKRSKRKNLHSVVFLGPSYAPHMDQALLIDAVVRQTTVLLAQLATTGNVRAPLAPIANQVFLSLVQELRRQGVASKVISDMFGMALRTYQHRVRQLTESSTIRGKSLWEAVLDWVTEHGPVVRAEILRRFSNDDSTVVRAVLSDLVGNQLLSKTGRGDSTTYRVATDADRPSTDSDATQERLALLSWVAIYRFGPLTPEQLEERIPANPAELEGALSCLVEDGRVTAGQGTPEVTYTANGYEIPHGSTSGWEAAVFDHYQAMVTALCIKLRQGEQVSAEDDVTGGSTYAFDLWKTHPLHSEVSGLLRRFRQESVELLERLQEYNRSHELPEGAAWERITTYVGQSRIIEQNGEV